MQQNMTECQRKVNMRKKPSVSLPPTQLLALVVALLLPYSCNCFLPTTSIRKKHSTTAATTSSTTTTISMVGNLNLYDPDMMEMFVGGERYENVPLPDSMLDTTIFVGNLCEFAQDEDLSQKFRSVTNLKSLPACVARRPNSQSLEYGFVAFPTVEEKEVGTTAVAIATPFIARRDEIRTTFAALQTDSRVSFGRFFSRRLSLPPLLNHFLAYPGRPQSFDFMGLNSWGGD